jgi:hypothetical protein
VIEKIDLDIVDTVEVGSSSLLVPTIPSYNLQTFRTESRNKRGNKKDNSPDRLLIPFYSCHSICCMGFLASFVTSIASFPVHQSPVQSAGAPMISVVGVCRVALRLRVRQMQRRRLLPWMSVFFLAGLGATAVAPLIKR